MEFLLCESHCVVLEPKVQNLHNERVGDSGELSHYLMEVLYENFRLLVIN